MAITCFLFEWSYKMNIYKHRDVRDDDIPTICQFPRDKYELFNISPYAQFPLTFEQLNETIKSRYSATVVLTDDNKIAGFANLINNNASYTIGNLIVNPEMRGKGVGYYLTKTMITISFKQFNIREIFVACFCKNTPGLLLYTKIGFIPFFIDKMIDPDNKPIARITFKYNITSIEHIK